MDIDLETLKRSGYISQDKNNQFSRKIATLEAENKRLKRQVETLERIVDDYEDESDVWGDGDPRSMGWVGDDGLP